MSQTGYTYEDDMYLSRAMSSIGKQKEGWKLVLLCALIAMIPIIGPIWSLGFIYKWAKNIAWGLNEPLSTDDLEIGSCLSLGLKVFVVGFVWGLIAFAFFYITAPLCEIQVLGPIFSLIGWALSILIGFAISVGSLRAVIYDDIAAGLQFAKVWEMMTRNPGRLVRPILADVAVSIILSLIALVVIVLGISFVGFGFVGLGYCLHLLDSSSNLALIEYAIRYLPIVFLIVKALGLLRSLFTTLIYAMWMIQFDLPRWGGKEDPIPDSLESGQAPHYTV